MKKIDLILLVSLLIAGNVFAQGASPVKVNKITVTPSSFKAGDVLTFTIEIQNTSRNTYGCVGDSGFKVFLDVFNAERLQMDNWLWGTEQPLTSPLAPGEKRTITFSSKWTVPKICPEKIVFLGGGPWCAPDEFNQTAYITFSQTCLYERKISQILTGKMSRKELRK
jgi:hypothetical protein